MSVGAHVVAGPRSGPRRVVVALAGASLLAVGTPGLAAAREDPEQAAALEMLTDAAQASRSLSYTGTQYVATWGPAQTTTTLVEVEHRPGRGAHVRPTDEGDVGEPVLLPDGELDEQLLEVLRDRYVLRLAGEGRCTGRTAHVVEAHRPGERGPEAVAGRFWLDADTGLLLRREVFDAEGRRLRSSAFLDLEVRASSAPALVPALLRGPAPDHDAWTALPASRLRGSGQPVPEELPGGFALFEVGVRDHGGGQVVHLAYSDGLSTTSLFSQPGELGSSPPDGFGPATVAGRPVWAHLGAPQRMVWAGGGRVWTLVSDAPQDAVSAAVGALPHEPVPSADDGWRARLARGVARLAAALNPFS